MKKMDSLVIVSLTNRPKLKKGLADKLIEKHIVSEIMSSTGLELV